MINVGEVSLGKDIIKIYNHLKEIGWNVEALAEKKNFHNLVTATKDNENFLIGSNNHNEISYFVHNKSVNNDEFSLRYIKLLEIFHSSGYSSFKSTEVDTLKKSLDPLEYINAAYSSSHNVCIIARKKQENEEDTLSIICTSASLLGFHTPDDNYYPRNVRKSRDDDDGLDLWDTLGIVGGIATIAGFF